MSNRSVIQAEDKSVLTTYNQFPVALKRGKGSYVWDEDGKAYLDFVTGIAVNALGHAHPALVKAICEQAGLISHTGNLFHQGVRVKLAEELIKNSFAEKVAFANTGAEANELLIKFARKFGRPQGRGEILAFYGGFHGRTYGALSASGQEKLHKGMEPLLPGFRHATYNDLSGTTRAINRHTCAMLVEPIQGESGIKMATPEFMVGLRRLCDRNNLLLMFDEIQTGLGRTGTMFGYQHFGHDCVPDICSVGKSLGGGLPLSAVLAGPKAKDLIGLGEHGTTMGGNAIACAAGLALLGEIKSKKVLANVVKMGALLKEGLDKLKTAHPRLVKDVRQRGLMIGVELTQPAKFASTEALKLGLIVNATADTVMRLLPPLNVTEAECKEALQKIGAALTVLEKKKGGTA